MQLHIHNAYTGKKLMHKGMLYKLMVFFLDIILASNDSLPVLDGKQNLLMWAYCLGDEKIYFFVFFEKRFLD